MKTTIFAQKRVERPNWRLVLPEGYAPLLGMREPNLQSRKSKIFSRGI
jgi:hypothetical protein